VEMTEGMTVWKPKEIENSALDDYSNFIKWTEYIVPAPMVIALLGELAVLSNQYQDFGLETPEGATFKHIQYPKSYKTTLMQICDESYYTFNSAHHNMDQLRQQTARVPRLLSNIVTLLVTGDDEDVHDYLPILLKGIKKIAQDSKSLFHETAEKFDQTASLIDEVTLASKYSQGKSEVVLVLSKLSAQWQRMADFFKMMEQFIGIVEKGLSNIEEKHKQMSHFAKQSMFGYARESASYAFVINRFSTGYFKISSGYLLNPMASLKELMALDAKDEHMLMKKKTQLRQQADAAIAKIKEFGQKEAERTTDSLQEKMKAIDKEFNEILSTQTPGEEQAIIQKPERT